MPNINPMLLTDGYKLDHRRQYPSNTTLIYSNFTPRKSREPTDRIVLFGLQYLCKEYFIKQMKENFFERPLQEVLDEYRECLDSYFGPNTITLDHIEALHNLGYLPLHIKAIPEGESVPQNTPVLTIHNTKPEFFWLTNYFETLISNVLWMPCTSATTSRLTYQMMVDYANETCDNNDHLPFQSHDFSMRGHGSVESSLVSTAGHLLYFLGSDTFPVTKWIKQYYSTDQLVACSVPATEHSVMCVNSEYVEREVKSPDGDFIEVEATDLPAVERVLDLYPTGIVSIVADSFDYFRLLTEYLPKLKDKIEAREGKVVIRPDSGHPNLIVNGDPNSSDIKEQKGSLDLLGEVFGCTLNKKGYKVLNPKIGLIYGDGCNLKMQTEILDTMKLTDWASSNIVFGTGSFAYQYVTRDTHGFAMKATYAELEVEGAHGKGTYSKNIFKDPATDKNKLKKSHKGLLHLSEEDILAQEVSWPTAHTGRLQDVFVDGVLVRDYEFEDVRYNAQKEFAPDTEFKLTVEDNHV